ncbi:sulfatase family protein [Parapedobacter tibetensis]|uniref:sulfatase family protein n=1 Tax=Parapedobacter tibetensis TaxID=2972951 RepID=UPI00214DE11E|nr:arylsulfatase [Parapedobacter tibetensis]
MVSFAYRRRYLFFVCQLVLLVTPSFGQEKGRERPNIVIILVDDMGYGDVGAYNAQAKIPTLHIDRLANEGMRFTDAHAPGAVCHPSRYGLITGRYPFRTDVSVWPEKPVIEPGRMTIASLLRSNGYRTAMVGKWHLGFDESEAVAASTEHVSDDGNSKAAYRVYQQGQRLSGGPVDCGFDSFFGIRASTDIPPYFFIRNDRVVTPPTDTIEDHNSPDWTPIQGAFWRGGGIAPGLNLADVLPRFSEEAVEVIEDHAKGSAHKPLFLHIAFPAPHTPWLPADNFRGKSGAGEYGDFVATVDAEVGKILSALDSTGMSDETLVIFTSDNGPVWYLHDTRRFGHHASAGIRLAKDGSTSYVSYRGMKGDTYEAGHHMPFIVRWPRVVKAGALTGQTVSFTDVMATFAAIVGVDLPTDAGEDSFSLLPVLTGEQPEQVAIRPPVVSVSSLGVRSIQSGRWKLIESLGSGGFSRPASIEAQPEGPKGQLYDLSRDPEEVSNVWNDYPDMVDEMRALLQKWDRAGTSRMEKMESHR